jgi:hypothetical protein
VTRVTFWRISWRELQLVALYYPARFERRWHMASRPLTRREWWLKLQCSLLRHGLPPEGIR